MFFINLVNRLRLVPIFLGLLGGTIGKAQQPLLPAGWLGKWADTLHIYNAKGLAQSVPMQLRILPTDSTHRFTFTIIYGTDTVAGKRDYELKVLDASKGWYAVDEKNTIVMESYLLGSKMYNLFEVMGNVLLATTELVGEHLVYEVISTGKQPVSVSGNQKFRGEDIPPVSTYPVNVRQIAVLKRKKE